MTILIKGGRILDPATKTDDVMDLFIEDGVITKRGKKYQEKGREDYRCQRTVCNAGTR